jgi:hypothetical protein
MTRIASNVHANRDCSSSRIRTWWKGCRPLAFSVGWVAVAKIRGYQSDVCEVTFRSTYVDVSTKSEADPSAPFANASLRDSVDVLLLLEYLCILRHVLRRVERIEVANVEL